MNIKKLFGFEIAHIGINCSDIYEAKKNAEIFCGIFNFDMKEGRSSFFAGNGIEIVKRKYLGTHGHIAFKTDNIDAAVEYLQLKGYGFSMDTAKRNAKGELTAIYLGIEIAGFAIHLVRK